jgi:hypothetical protein
MSFNWKAELYNCCFPVICGKLLRKKNFWWDLFEIAQKCELMGPESGVVKPVRNSLAGSVTLFEKLRRS